VLKRERKISRAVGGIRVAGKLISSIAKKIESQTIKGWEAASEASSVLKPGLGVDSASGAGVNDAILICNESCH